MFIYRVCDAFEQAKVEYAVVGGYAVALHGAVRGTIDLDIVLAINEKNFSVAEEVLNRIGLSARLPVRAKEVFKFRKEYIEKKNLIAWNFYNPKDALEVVDIIITHDLKKMKKVVLKSGSHKLSVLSIPDLIKMKRESGRPQDLEDARVLERLK